MTAIAYRDGVLAADSGIFLDQVVLGSQPKIIEVGPSVPIPLDPSGQRARAWCATSGSCGTEHLFTKWLRGGEPLDPPKLDDPGFSAIVAFQTGEAFHFAADGKILQLTGNAPYAAIGCAEEFLLGAMAAGETADGAVALAIKHTAWARGPLCWLTAASGLMEMEFMR